MLVLDEAPSELVQLIGYLEGISSGIVLDLITVSAYQAGSEQLLVPQRVDPEHPGERTPAAVAARSASKSRREVDGSAAFEEAIARAPEPSRLSGWFRCAGLRPVAGRMRSGTRTSSPTRTRLSALRTATP